MEPLELITGGLFAAAIGSLFAAGDAALQALPEARLRAIESDRTKKALFARYLDDRERVLSRWLVARVIAIAIAAAFFEGACERAGHPRLGAFVAIFGAAATYGSFAEIMVSLARRRPETIGAAALRFLKPLEWAVLPLAEPLAILGRAITRSVRQEPIDSARVTETEVQWLINQGEQAGAIAGGPAEIMRNALELRDTTARDVMVPRRNVSAIDAATTLERALEIVGKEAHSRYPVFQGTVDHIVGLLYAKDLFRVVRNKNLSKTRVETLVRSPALFVTETQLVATILREMRAKRLHMAIVSDEFGGTSGVITLEDIIEEIVGDIRDEHDIETQFEDMPDGSILADASVSLADLSTHLKHEILAEGDFESIGGLLIHKAGRVPEVGTTVEHHGLKFIVREADETRVVKVEIIKEVAA